MIRTPMLDASPFGPGCTLGLPVKLKPEGKCTGNEEGTLCHSALNVGMTL